MFLFLSHILGLNFFFLSVEIHVALCYFSSIVKYVDFSSPIVVHDHHYYYCYYYY